MSRGVWRRNLKRIGCILLVTILVLACAPVVAYLWPAFVYPPLLRSLPEPPGYIRTSDYVGGAELDFRDWTRGYDVDQSFEEVVSFFKTELPRRGWQLTRESSRTSWGSVLQSDLVRAVLVFHGPWFLSFDIQIEVLAEMKQGEQVGTVRVFIYDEPH
jgi:hypothetical protein